jgi:hypothetical protein
MSLPTAETEGLYAGEPTISVGALPGSANETSVAVLPEGAAFSASHTGTTPSTGATPDHHHSTEAAVLGTAAIATGVLLDRHHEQGIGSGRGHHRLGHQAGAVRGAVGRPRALDARQRRGRGVRAPSPRRIKRAPSKRHAYWNAPVGACRADYSAPSKPHERENHNCGVAAAVGTGPAVSEEANDRHHDETDSESRSTRE